MKSAEHNLKAIIGVTIFTSFYLFYLAGLSYVEWRAGGTAGPPDAFVCCPWDADWEYMLAYLREKLGDNARVWVNLCACQQHLIHKDKNMQEVQLIPRYAAIQE
jgi:hypothetical protein